MSYDIPSYSFGGRMSKEIAELLMNAANGQTNEEAEEQALDFVQKNFEAIMNADLPEEEKDFLSEIIEGMEGDLTDQISEYEMGHHGLEKDDMLGYAKMIDELGVEDEE